MTDVSDFDTAISTAATALDDAIAALEAAQAIEATYDDAATAAGIGLPTTDEKQAALDFKSEIGYSITPGLATAIGRIRGARRMLREK
jgi:hypothetical protein